LITNEFTRSAAKSLENIKHPGTLHFVLNNRRIAAGFLESSDSGGGKERFPTSRSNDSNR
jgi:hypothetical protein